ncbi:hypothetical protein, partial [Sphingobacterium faecale]|uniref:hypothetical protein n=1 Tax=Sphingobacterium faecale TaxID=2803775 RepID=UPI001F2C7D61
SLKDPQLITRLLKIYTKVVCFAAESLVYFGAEWWCNIVRNMQRLNANVTFISIYVLFFQIDIIFH